MRYSIISPKHLQALQLWRPGSGGQNELLLLGQLENGQLAQLVQNRGQSALSPEESRFRSSEDLETTIKRYVKLYNDHLPQWTLGHQTPLQALRIWHKDRPELFVRKPNNQAGLDS